MPLMDNYYITTNREGTLGYNMVLLFIITHLIKMIIPITVFKITR